jgi:NADH-quinone oxidoreductase subunit M
VLTVVYVLMVVQKTLFGETRSEEIRKQSLADLTVREALILAPLAAVVLFIGFHPQPILNLFQGPVLVLIGYVK